MIVDSKKEAIVIFTWDVHSQEKILFTKDQGNDRRSEGP